MTQVEEAEKTLATLEDKRRALVDKATELADERQRISFAAHAGGDAKARKRLDEINAATVSHSSEMESVGAAIAEASRRVEAARRDAAAAEDRAQATQLRAKLAKLVELGEQVDDALWDFGTSITAMIGLLNEIHALGQAAPTSDQFRIAGTMAIKSKLQELPTAWVNDFEFQRLLPGQKKKFKDLVEGWRATTERNIAARLGIKQEAA